MSYQAEFTTCPEKTLYHAQRQLLRLRMQPFMKLVFLDPRLATHNDLLRNKKFLYSHQ